MTKLERDDLAARKAAEKCAAAAAAAAAAAEKDARITAELQAAGLERITKVNAASYPPPKLWARNRRKDAYLHIRRLPKQTDSCYSFERYVSTLDASAAPAVWYWQMTCERPCSDIRRNNFGPLRKICF